MATMAKKIQMKNSAGKAQTALIYSTTGESGTPNLPLKVDGVQGYACLVGTSDARATSGRVKSSGGTQYAIGARGVPAYDHALYATSGTFTVPANVTKLRVTCVGGGAGGMAVTRTVDGPGTFDSGTYTFNGVEGGETSFGSIKAGGAASSVYSFLVQHHYDGEGGWWYTDCTVLQNTVSVGSTNGIVHTGGAATVNGAAALALEQHDGTVAGYAGSGGKMVRGTSGSDYYRIGFTGGSGYKVVQELEVTAGQTIAYVIGNGGKCNVNGTKYASEYNFLGNGAAPGGNGAILVEWGDGIQ